MDRYGYKGLVGLFPLILLLSYGIFFSSQILEKIPVGIQSHFNCFYIDVRGYFNIGFGFPSFFQKVF